MLRARVALAALTVALGALVACSAIVSSELSEVSCGNEGAVGPPSCPGGQRCLAGACTACASSEQCGNGIDDDCDQQIDELCPGDAGTGGNGGLDAGTGGSAGVSGAGGSGGAPGGGGAVGGGGLGGTGAAGGGTGGTGATGGTGGVTGQLGSSCVADPDCTASGLFCSAPADFGGTGTEKLCTESCCTSDDCGSGDLVCFPALGGFGVCLPAASVGRPAPGNKTSGATCGGDSECRSAACDAGRCLDVCCSDGDCLSGHSCTFTTVKGSTRRAFQCVPKQGSGGYQSPCSAGSQCASGVCVDFLIDFCTKPCCTTQDCNGVVGLRCVYAGISSTGETLRVCGTSPQTGSLPNGAECTAGLDCQSGRCLDPGGGKPWFCSDTCCDDKDCGNPGVFGCRPFVDQGTTLLLCAPL